MLSDEKLDVHLTEYPCIWCQFSHPFTILSFNNLLMMCFLEFTELLGGTDSCLSSNLGNCQLLFLHIFFLPLSVSSLLLGFPIWMSVGLMGTHRSLRVCSFFIHPFFFLLFKLDNFSWPILKLMDSPAHLTILMKPSSEFFGSVILSSSKIFNSLF